MCRNCFKPLELVAENIGFISTSFCPSQLSLDKALKLAIQIVLLTVVVSDCSSCLPRSMKSSQVNF